MLNASAQYTISNANIQLRKMTRHLKLKPLSLNRYTVTDIFEFATEIRNLEIANGDILVSYDVSSLFTNVPLGADHLTSEAGGGG